MALAPKPPEPVFDPKLAIAIAVANGHPDPEAYAARVAKAYKGEPLDEAEEADEA